MAKSTKETAKYTDNPSWVTHGTEKCRVCKMFVKPNSCTSVQGKISPGGWCKYFERRK